MVKKPASRIFGGKRYKWFDDYNSRVAANTIAKTLRRGGKYARVVEAGGKFVVYYKR